MQRHSQLPLVKLPDEVQQALCLIREELKSRKLFQALRKAGLDDCYFQPNLDSLILHSVGLDGTDEIFNTYSGIMERRSRKIEADHESITRQALKVYWELIRVKKAQAVEKRGAAY